MVLGREDQIKEACCLNSIKGEWEEGFQLIFLGRASFQLLYFGGALVFAFVWGVISQLSVQILQFPVLAFWPAGTNSLTTSTSPSTARHRAFSLPPQIPQPPDIDLHGTPAMGSRLSAGFFGSLAHGQISCTLYLTCGKILSADLVNFLAATSWVHHYLQYLESSYHKEKYLITQ